MPRLSPTPRNQTAVALINLLTGVAIVLAVVLVMPLREAVTARLDVVGVPFGVAAGAFLGLSVLVNGLWLLVLLARRSR